MAYQYIREPLADALCHACGTTEEKPYNSSSLLFCPPFGC